jgi:cytoskeletal protein RodZ
MQNEEATGREPRAGASWLWFVGGCALSITTLSSIVLLVFLLISTSLNVYLAWTLSGYEVSISRPGSVSTVVIVVTPASQLALAPTETPTAEPTSTPSPVSTPSRLETEFATLAAITTQVAQSNPTSTPAFTPEVTAADVSESTVASTPEATARPAATPTPSAPAQALAASTNSYTLIPIEGERESRPAAEHGDLNLKLRDPQPAGYEPKLIDIPGSGIDPQAPKLSAVFKPDFVATYAVHDWDWGCNCKGKLIEDGTAVLVGIKTTPGDPIFIPKTERDIYEGKYYAVVLYAAQDTLTFLYARRGSVVEGYTVHYLGLQTDPNLVALFQESQGNELPGLTLDTPVGIATDQLIVAIRDNGKFLDARSKRDWWE